MGRHWHPLIALFPLALLTQVGCISLQVALDRQGLDEVAREMLVGPLGAPAELDALVAHWQPADAGSLARRQQAVEQGTEQIGLDAGAGAERGPAHPPSGQPLPTLTLADGRVVVPRRITLPSTLARHDQGPRAVYWLYQGGPLAGGRAILWAPGLGFSELALRFVRPFWQAGLEADWSVLVWVPPYHLERRAPGADDGQAFFVADPADNLGLFGASAQELLAARRWLQAQGVARIGGWAGSLGAAVLMAAHQDEPLDHLALMIPLLDWRDLALEHQALAAVRARWRAAGFSFEQLARAFALMSPVRLSLPAAPERSLLLLARHDQLTPLSLAERWAQERGIAAVHVYERSHATILLEEQVVRDYERYLAGLDGVRLEKRS